MSRFHLILPLTFVLASAVSHSAPFRVLSEGDLRPDAELRWAGISTTHGTVLSDLEAVTPTDGGPDLQIRADGSSTATIWNQPGLSTSGVLLENSGPDPLLLYLNREVQAFGLTFEHRFAVSAEYFIDCYDSGGSFLFTTSVASSDQGNPAFLGAVDPEARIAIVALRATPGNTFVVGNGIVSLPVDPEPDYSTLPVATEVVLPVKPTDSYLHEGLRPKRETPATLTAVEDNENAHDLRQLFPGLRAGDVLRFERIGIALKEDRSINALLGLFSSSQTILDGSAIPRVPDAIDAGQDYYTGPVSSESRFATPTNLPQDFIIGLSNFVVVPDRSHFLMLSMADLAAAPVPLSVRISHIPRRPFEAWAASFGLHGSLLHPDSDLDGDGLTLIQEYAFLKNPTSDAAEVESEYIFQPIVASFESSTRFRLRFGARRDAPLRFMAEFSSDLVDWDERSATEVFPVLDNPDDPSTVVYSVSDFPEQEGVGQRFGRLRIELIPESE